MYRTHHYKYAARSIVLLFLITSFVSCKKYLEQKPDASLVSPSSLSDLQALLDDPATMNQSRTPSYGETSCDEYFLTDNLFNSSESIRAGSQDLYTWQYYPMTGGGNDWSACYTPVYNANLVLDEIKSIPQTGGNKAAWDNVKGSALFFRGYYFLQLLWDYAKAYDSSTAAGDPGIVLRLTSDFNVPSTRATNEASYNQVLEDAKASVALLPQYPLTVLRPSKGAAYGLLARCYLSMRDYRDARLYADSALQVNDQLMDFNGDDDIPSGLSVKGVFKKLNKEIIFYTEMNKSNFLPNTVSFSRIDTTIYRSYQSNDLRKTAFYYSNADGYMSFKGSYAISYSTCFSGMATDEMYLVRAECAVRAGDVAAGLNDLNTLLSKRFIAGTFVPYADLSQDSALNVTVREREKELMMRALRWPDLKRYNREGRNITLKRVADGQTYLLQPNAGFYALPIPQDIIQMTGIAQNDIN